MRLNFQPSKLKLIGNKFEFKTLSGKPITPSLVISEPNRIADFLKGTGDLLGAISEDSVKLQLAKHSVKKHNALMHALLIHIEEFIIKCSEDDKCMDHFSVAALGIDWKYKDLIEMIISRCQAHKLRTLVSSKGLKASSQVHTML
jgi:hypothetical protein